jgi:hypothetical protein
MRHRSRRLRPALPALAATGLTLGLAGIGSAGVAGPVSAEDTPRYSANASAALVQLSALQTTPLGLRSLDLNGRGLDPHSLINLRVATSDSKVNSHHRPETRAEAEYLDTSLLGQRIALPNATIGQSAGPDNPRPAQIPARAIDLGLVKVGTGKLSAHARWNAETALPQGPADLTESSESIANLSLLPSPRLGGLGGTALVEIPHIAASRTATELVKVSPENLGVQSLAQVSATDIVLFRGTPLQKTIRVISPPSLRVVAAGNSKSFVDYTSPLVEIVDARGRSQRLETPNAVVSIPLPGILLGATPIPTGPAGRVVDGAPDILCSLLCAPEERDRRQRCDDPCEPPRTSPALLRVSLGAVQKWITAQDVRAKAATLRVEVLSTPSSRLLDLGVGQLEASARVPEGGIHLDDPEPEPSASPSTTVSPIATPSPAVSPSLASGGGGGLPVTGASLPYILGAGLAALVLGSLAILRARRSLS